MRVQYNLLTPQNPNPKPKLIQENNYSEPQYSHWLALLLLILVAPSDYSLLRSPTATLSLDRPGPRGW